MIKCIFCGHPEIKQPAVSTAIVTNVTPMCEYHYKMFKDWATDEERAKMEKIYNKYKRRRGHD